jgi:Glycosyl-transferase for dystroglycan
MRQQDEISSLFTLPALHEQEHQNQNGGIIITCAMQGGINKLSRLLDMTSQWLGPVSFSMVITSESDLETLFDFWHSHTWIQQYVSIHILMELPQLHLPKLERYPINQLRNLALHNVKTDYVFLNDVDFIPSDHAHDEIAALIKVSPPSLHMFWVLPAFERFKFALQPDITPADDPVTDVAMIPKTKSELIEAMQEHNKVVTTFHPYSDGQRQTHFHRWLRLTETTTDKNNGTDSNMYPIEDAKWFEPYMVCNVHDLHEYFPAFRGFGLNKASFFIQAKVRGDFDYMVLSQQFVVHMNHPGRAERSSKHAKGQMLTDFTQYLQDTYDISRDELKQWLLIKD